MAALAAGREDWEFAVDSLARGDVVAMAKTARLVTGHLQRFRAYDARERWDDLVPNVLASLIGAARRHEIRAPGAFVSYVGRVTRDALLEWSDSHKEVGATHDDPAAVAAHVEGREAGERAPDQLTDLRRALAGLRKDERGVVEALSLHGQSHEETARALGMSVAALERVHSQTLKTLRIRLRSGVGTNALNRGGESQPEERLVELLMDVLGVDQPSPELMARFAESPALLSSEEHVFVESAFAHNSALQDELHVLVHANALGREAGSDPLAGPESDRRGDHEPSAVRSGLAPRVLVSALAVSTAAAGLGWWLFGPGGWPGSSHSNDERRPATAATRPNTAFEASLEATPDLLPARTDDVVPIELTRLPGSAEGVPEIPPFDPAILGSLRDPVYEVPLDSVTAERPTRLVYSDSGRTLLAPLAPTHVALTAVAQPTLLWASSAELPLDAELYFVLTDEGAVEPALRRRIPAPTEPGLQRLHIAHFEVSLPLGVPLTWSIVWRPDPTTPASDVMTIGTIQRVAGSPEAAYIEAAELPGWSARLADTGLWYDSLTALAYLMDVAPERREPRRALQSLLLQEDLTDAADLID